MVDTIRSPSDLTTNLFQDGQPAGSITPNDARDLIVSAFGVFTPTAKTASYTLVLTDAGTTIRMNLAGANNLTVPLNSSVAFPIGTVISIRQTGAGQTTIVATGGVTLISSSGTLTLRAQGSLATLTKDASDTWYVDGDLT